MMRQALPAGLAPDGAPTAGRGPPAVVRPLPGQLPCSRPGTQSTPRRPLAGVRRLRRGGTIPPPIEDVDPGLLYRFTLADDGRMRTLTTSGVRWRNRYDVGEWMHGGADAGTKVR